MFHRSGSKITAPRKEERAPRWVRRLNHQCLNRQTRAQFVTCQSRAMRWVKLSTNQEWRFLGFERSSVFEWPRPAAEEAVQHWVRVAVELRALGAEDLTPQRGRAAPGRLCTANGPSQSSCRRRPSLGRLLRKRSARTTRSTSRTRTTCWPIARPDQYTA